MNKLVMIFLWSSACWGTARTAEQMCLSIKIWVRQVSAAVPSRCHEAMALRGQGKESLSLGMIRDCGILVAALQRISKPLTSASDGKFPTTSTNPSPCRSRSAKLFMILNIYLR